jgi:plasmid maintenance system antidote protein VapI
MEKVKKLVEAGAPIPEAIRVALGMPVSAFALRYGLPRSSVANHLNATVRATDETIAALVQELGGTSDEWRELLWLAKPRKVATA